ncbi:MAG TPA: DUF5677 domain-containing protein [Solirubrobacterales bacterium]|nr:DUF5677 domain-containing protein [Solirubrobacterales bacterium]
MDGDDANEGIPLSEDDFPPRYEPDLQSLKTDDGFGEAAFELLKETGMTLVYLVGRIPDMPYQRNESIRRGLIKRLMLLGKSLLSDVAHNSGYQQLQITRQIAETAANYFYLAQDDGSEERYDAYINQALAEEKHNLGVVAGEIKERGGDPLPIEERMRRSIERMASAAGVDFEAVPKTRDSGWPGAFDRLSAMSPTAYPAYRAGSSALHAGWSALLLQDLEEVEGGFSLNAQVEPRPQPLTMAGMLLTEAAIYYLEEDGDDAERQLFLGRLTDLSERVRSLDEAHERFQQSI